MNSHDYIVKLDDPSALLSSKMEPGHYCVKDPTENKKYDVNVIEIGRTTDTNEPLVEIECNCRFYWHYRMHCSHTFAVLNTF